MKRSWITWPIVGGVIVLLTIFLALQYRWQVQAGEAEREILQKRVEADARRFAEDFDREIQGAYFNFQMDADAWQRGDWKEFNERYDFWRSKTAFPGIVRDFYYLNDRTDTCLRFDFDKRGFAGEQIPENIARLKKLASKAETFRSVYQDELAMVMPIHSAGHSFERIGAASGIKMEPRILEMPAQFGYLLIQLDREYVTKRMLPELAAKYFPNGDIKIDVRDQERHPVFQNRGDVMQSDATTRFFTLSPENMIFFADKRVLPRSANREQDLVVNQHIENRSFTGPHTVAESAKTFTFEVNSDGVRKKAAVFSSSAGDGDGWVLSVEHTSGSVDAFINGELNRKLFTGLAVYLLVVGAIIAIAFSAMRAQRSAQRQVDFVSSVSHEFRTPLAVIYSAGENLADGVAKDETQVERYGSLIKSEGKKLSSMVEQILEFAGARSGQRKYSFETTNVNEVIEKALLENRSNLSNHRVAIEKNLSDRLPAIKADPEALSSAVQNLIQNAVKYSNGDRRIQIATFVRNNGVAIEVTDNGIGIPSADLRKIFEPFYRAKDVVDAQIHGNGLGLSLVKEIAEAHGGSVFAESKKGKGSKFTINLPV